LKNIPFYQRGLKTSLTGVEVQGPMRRSDAVGFVVVRCSMIIDKPECVTMFDEVNAAQQDCR
jgi:hypothetical protein